MSREEIFNKITTLTAGRASEELIFSEVTSGAANDIEKATKLARAMVTRLGMSEQFDMTALEVVNNVYLGGDASLACSPATAAKIDQEVMSIIRSAHEKAMQRALIQYRDPANYDLVKEALLRTGRADLIGFGDKCLIPPRQMKRGELTDRHTDHKNRKNDHNNRKNGRGRTDKTSDYHHGKDGKRHTGAPAKKRQIKR